jgi:hypothetical protein
MYCHNMTNISYSTFFFYCHWKKFHRKLKFMKCLTYLTHLYVAHYHACYYSHNIASMQLVTIVNHLL